MSQHDESKELCPHCQRIAEELPKMMDQIRQLVGTDDTRLTLIIRSPDNSDSSAVMTDEDDLELALAQAARFNEEVIKPTFAKTRLH